MKIIFSIIGTLIGAGFASGQEVYKFFYSYGIKGIFGIFISSFLMGILIYKAFKIIERNDIKNYEDFLASIIKSNKIRNIIGVVVNVFILVSFYVMIAGFGAYLKQEYNVNNLVGSSTLAIVCYFIFRKNIKGLVKINEILIPILISIIIFIRDLQYKKYRFLRNYTKFHK